MTLLIGDGVAPGSIEAAHRVRGAIECRRRDGQIDDGQEAALELRGLSRPADEFAQQHGHKLRVRLQGAQFLHETDRGLGKGAGIEQQGMISGPGFAPRRQCPA